MKFMGASCGQNNNNNNNNNKQTLQNAQRTVTKARAVTITQTMTP